MSFIEVVFYGFIALVVLALLIFGFVELVSGLYSLIVLSASGGLGRALFGLLLIAVSGWIAKAARQAFNKKQPKHQ